MTFLYKIVQFTLYAKIKDMRQTFNQWVEAHKRTIQKIAEKTRTPYSDLVARLSYVWENGKMDTGQHFETQCPLFGEMDKKDPLFKLGRSAFYHARQKNDRYPS